MTPILLLEINEIPWRVLDKYLSGGGYTNLSRFFGASAQYTTINSDVGELSPWVTWPTLHRGMTNSSHGVLNLGQDPSTFRGVAIWDEVRSRGGSVGVCGSMQSWPPRDPGPDGFYVPDTFAHDSQCIPAKVSPFQEFNLGQVQRNARVVNQNVPKPLKALRVAVSALRSGVRLRTLGRVARQIWMERSRPDLTKRRPIFQTILFWDVFTDLFDPRRPPAFSTFFTNHVAGVMHRYWHDVFPEDFVGRQGNGVAAPSGQEPLMRFAIQVLDDMLGDVIKWVDSNPDLVVVLASSMGQQAVSYEDHEGVEFVVEDLTRLMAMAGSSAGRYTRLLAMAPQVAVDIPDQQHRDEVAAALQSTVDAEGKPFITVQSIGTSLSITVRTPRRSAIASGHCVANGREVSWQDAGIRPQDVEPGSGYHIPEGSLAFFGKGIHPQGGGRLNVPSEQVKDWLLRISQQGGSQALCPPSI
jgi:hypothetical protein